jgi:tetratricopeptide (TPR) repeat protein
LGEVLALRGLGEVERLAGEYDLARDYYTQALTLARHLGDRLAEAGILVELGYVAPSTLKRGQAWRQAREIYEALGIPLPETVRITIKELDC